MLFFLSAKQIRGESYSPEFIISLGGSSCRHLFCLILASLIFGPQGMGGSQEVDFEKEAARILAKTKELHELSNIDIVTSGQ